MLRVENLVKHYPMTAGLIKKGSGAIKAVDGISFSLEKGRTFGLVGESGCGKSTTGKLLVDLEKPTSGTAHFYGQDLFNLPGDKKLEYRRKIQMIFQDPYGSLNPRLTVKEIIAEPLIVHKLCGKRERNDRIADLLLQVGLDSTYMNRFPHEFSGGQRQRIGIARALAIEPELIICDEPVSALDVSIQAQIINLMKSLQSRLNLTYLFIAHDLSVVKHISDTIQVMYLGKIVESAVKKELFNNPLHPYTRALLSSIPVPDPEYKQERIILQGDLPKPSAPPPGCRFNTRCFMAKERCRLEEPAYLEHSPGHYCACHYPGVINS